MGDKARGDFQARLTALLTDLELSAGELAAQGPRVSGPQCRLDQDTFGMLSSMFPRRKYSHGVMEGFAQVKDFLQPTDLHRASQAVIALRQRKGKHGIQVLMLKSQLEELGRIAHQAELSASAVLEATTYLFVRAESSSSQAPLFDQTSR
ncbi:hypothetical protein [Mesoterricola silvestris]|uniref:hypothetical protein n=1 Tax=Mesoterricola silvestris TaxID=2927979 RepID=UPI002931B7B4|nr:hypothetical protein [Mesoterricola silvestris]